MYSLTVKSTGHNVCSLLLAIYVDHSLLVTQQVFRAQRGTPSDIKNAGDGGRFTHFLGGQRISFIILHGLPKSMLIKHSQS